MAGGSSCVLFKLVCICGHRDRAEDAVLHFAKPCASDLALKSLHITSIAVRCTAQISLIETSTRPALLYRASRVCCVVCLRASATLEISFCLLRSSTPYP